MVNKFFLYLVVYVMMGSFGLYAGKEKHLHRKQFDTRISKDTHTKDRNQKARDRKLGIKENPPMPCCEVLSIGFGAIVGFTCGLFVDDNNSEIKPEVISHKLNETLAISVAFGLTGAVVGEVAYDTFFKKKKKKRD